MPMSAPSAGPYSAQAVMLYVLLVADVVINATADASGEELTRFFAIFVLVAQLMIRIVCIFTTFGLLGSTGSWQDEFLLRYFGVFGVSLASLILCLFLRVFRVTLASFPSQFPTVLDYWSTTEYCLLLLGHTLFSLLFYYCALCRLAREREGVDVDVMASVCCLCACGRLHHRRLLNGFAAVPLGAAAH